MFNPEVHCCTCLSENRKLRPAKLFKSFFKQFIKNELKNASGGMCWECSRLMIKFKKFKLQVHAAQEIVNERTAHIQALSNLTCESKDTYDYIFTHNPDPLTHDELEFDTKCFKEEPIEHCDDKNVNDFEDYSHDTKYNKAVECTIQINKFEIDDISVNAIDIDNNAIDCKVSTVEIEDTVHQSSKINQVIESDGVNSITEGYAIDNAIFIKEEKYINKTKKKTINKKILDTKNLPINGLRAENVKVKKEKLDIIPQEFKEKFDIVILTEVEMTRVREEKRNHYNFKKIPYKCDSCVLGFLKKENYESHVVKKHDEKIGEHTCPVCLVRFPKWSTAEQHQRKHYTVYACKLCKFKSSELWSASLHCRSRHGGDAAGSIHCPKCADVFKTREELEQHKDKEHQLCCSECGAQFKTTNSLSSHRLRVHAVQRDYICDVCRRPFKNRSRLETHLAGHESAVAKRLAYCAQCNVQYKNIHCYRNHLKYNVNHSQEVFTCQECGKRFATKYSCRKHYDFHHLNKSQIKCKLCNKIFISEWKLRTHKQKHHGMSRSRDHACGVCAKKFFTRATLRSHALTHSEERSYMCADCGDTFKQQAALYTHSRLVHKAGTKGKRTANTVASALVVE